MTKLNHIIEKVLLAFLKVFISSTLGGATAWCWVQFFNNETLQAYYRLGNYFLFFIILISYIFIARVYGSFDIGTRSVTEIIFSQIISIFIWLIVCYSLFSLISYHLVSVKEFLIMFVAYSLFAALWAFVANRLYFAIHKTKRVIVVYNNVDAYISLKGISNMKNRFKIIKTFNNDELPLEKLYDEIMKVDAVFLCGVPSDYRNEVVKFCVANDKYAYVKPKISDTIIHGSKTVQLVNIPIYRCSRVGSSYLYLVIKRFIDILFAICCIIVSSPFMLITAIAIKLYDRGPVFYKQKRLTKDQKVFEIIKFRSMRVDAEKDGVARLAAENDDRITPIGKIIRKLRIDELPQLFNILGGSMSVVGPRPERPEIFEQYEKTMPEFALRLQVKAGLTGYAQVYGKYNTPPYDKVQMDLEYIAKQSVWEDIKLMLLTFKILFMPDSTEGVEAGQVTAERNSEE